MLEKSDYRKLTENPFGKQYLASDLFRSFRTPMLEVNCSGHLFAMIYFHKIVYHECNRCQQILRHTRKDEFPQAQLALKW